MKARRGGFTLIEVLIVVVIMAVLAATIIPQFATSTKDASESALKFNLHGLRSQLELYKAQHQGRVPTLALIVNELTKTTDVTGAVGTGANYTFGPYVQGQLPANPFTKGNKVLGFTGTPTASGDADAGWKYDETTGRIVIDDANYIAL